jgi:hypothetical protein
LRIGLGSISAAVGPFDRKFRSRAQRKSEMKETRWFALVRALHAFLARYVFRSSVLMSGSGVDPQTPARAPRCSRRVS